MHIWLSNIKTNILESARINRLRKLPNGDAYVIILMKMLLHAKRNGCVCDGENYRSFANEIGEEYEMLIIAIAILREMLLVRLNEDEDIYIPQEILAGDET